MICWVDDNDELRRAVAERLRASGHQVLEAGSAEEALAALERGDGAPQLLLTDFRLPGRNGLELAATLRARPETSGLPVLLVTSHAGAKDLEGWLGKPRFAVLQKPFEIEDLDAAVSACLAGETPSTGFRPPVSNDGPVAAAIPPEATQSPWLRPALAAVLTLAVLAVLASVWPWLGGTTPPELPDAPDERDVRRSGALQTLEPFGPLAEVPSAFSWRPVQGAALYRLRVDDVAGTTLWQGEASDLTSATTEQLALPAELAERLLPLAAYYWQVEALDATGNTLAASDPVRFRIVQERSSP